MAYNCTLDRWISGRWDLKLYSSIIRTGDDMSDCYKLLLADRMAGWRRRRADYVYDQIHYIYDTGDAYAPLHPRVEIDDDTKDIHIHHLKEDGSLTDDYDAVSINHLQHYLETEWRESTVDTVRSAQSSKNRARNRVRGLIQANHFDRFVTLTFADSDQYDVHSYDDCVAYLSSYIAGLKYRAKRAGVELRYVFVAELQTATGRDAWHFHGLLGCDDVDILDREILSRVSVKPNRRTYSTSGAWLPGYSLVEDCTDQLAQKMYLSKYISKGGESSDGEDYDTIRGRYRKRYWASRNLVRPDSLRDRKILKSVEKSTLLKDIADDMASKPYTVYNPDRPTEPVYTAYQLWSHGNPTLDPLDKQGSQPDDIQQLKGYDYALWRTLPRSVQMLIYRIEAMADNDSDRDRLLDTLRRWLAGQHRPTEYDTYDGADLSEMVPFAPCYYIRMTADGLSVYDPRYPDGADGVAYT